MPSEEMLKKLLDEFVEKETFVTEELKLMSEQIEQLETRLDGCRARLSTIGTDRDKVLSIRSRYSDGTFYSSSASSSSMSPLSHASTYQPQTSAPPTQSAAPAARMPIAPPIQTAPVAPSIQAAPIAPPSTIKAPVEAGAAAAAPPAIQPAAEAAPPSRRTLTGLNAILKPRKADGSVSPPPPPPANFSSPELETAVDSSWESQLQPEPAPWEPAPEPQWTSSDFLNQGAAGVPAEEPQTPQWEMAAADEQQAAPANVGQEDPPPQADPSAQKNSDQGNVDLENETNEEGGNDTVKNINDALRSLFR